MIYIIDTHALLWYLEASPRHGERARRILEDADSRLVLCATAYAEACWICEVGRKVTLSAQTLTTRVDSDARILHFHLDRRLVERTT